MCSDTGCLESRHALEEREHRERKGHLDRIAVMLSRLSGRGYSVEEQETLYQGNDFDFDFGFLHPTSKLTNR